MDLEYDVPDVVYLTRQKTFSDYVFAGSVCIAVCLLFMFISAEVRHWYLLPIFLCGTIIGSDGIVWFRQKCDSFDLKGLIGIVGFYFFFLTPLLHIVLARETMDMADVPDWRPWFGFMGFINFAGIICYNVFQRIGFSGVPKQRICWYIDPNRAWYILISAIILGIISQSIILVKLGGLQGLMRSQFEEKTAFYGLGTFRIIGSALPLLCFIAIAMYIFIKMQRTPLRTTIIGLMFVFGLFQLIITGGYSARGEILAQVFWMFGIIHFFWRPLNQKFLLMFLVPGILFFWLYSFYKALGPQLFESGRASASLQDLSRETGRTFGGMLIGDLSRVDVQAYILFVQKDQSRDFKLRLGTTYLEAFTPIIPYWIWPSKPAHSGKVRAGTELFYGKGFYDPFSRLLSSRAYGLAGEAMLNFGFWGAPFAYAMWGFLIGRFRRFTQSLPAGDMRFLFFPYFIWLFVNMLLWDSDNYIAHTMLRAAFPFFVIFLMSSKRNPYESVRYSDLSLLD